MIDSFASGINQLKWKVETIHSSEASPPRWPSWVGKNVGMCGRGAWSNPTAG